MALRGCSGGVMDRQPDPLGATRLRGDLDQEIGSENPIVALCVMGSISSLVYSPHSIDRYQSVARPNYLVQEPRLRYLASFV